MACGSETAKSPHERRRGPQVLGKRSFFSDLALQNTPLSDPLPHHALTSHG
jgi:hypothetical protein